MRERRTRLFPDELSIKSCSGSQVKAAHPKTFLLPRTTTQLGTWGWYHGGRRPSSDYSFPRSFIPLSALDKPSTMKRYHRPLTTRWGVTARSPTMVTRHDTRFVECRWWNDGWTVKTVVTWRSSISMIPAPEMWGFCMKQERPHMFQQRSDGISLPYWGSVKPGGHTLCNWRFPH